MSDLHERVEAELENLRQVIADLPDVGMLDSASSLELAGTAALLHSFYNGVENILRQVLADRDEGVPRGAFWHRDLLQAAVDTGAVSAGTAAHLKRYLAFRHFFAHAYAFDVDKNRLIPLLEGIGTAWNLFVTDIQQILG